MALDNEILVGRFNRALQKIFGLKGTPPVPQLASEILPTINFPFDAVDRYLWGWELFGTVFSRTSGPGAVSAIRFRNPLGSNVVAEIVYSLHFTSVQDLSYALLVGTTNSALTGGDTPGLAGFDSRGRPSPTCLLSGQDGIPAGLNQFSFLSIPINGVVDTHRTRDHNWPLFPGSALDFRTSAVAVNQKVAIWWRERFLEESERT